jgi:hypothetical protein
MSDEPRAPSALFRFLSDGFRCASPTLFFFLFLFCALNLTADNSSMLQRVEADWLDQDQAFIEASENKRPFHLAHTAAVLDRAAKLMRRLSADAACENELVALQKTVIGAQRHFHTPIEQRCALYMQARRLLRRIAFTNPLLNMERILFIKRHHAKGVFHMCDQYYGFNAVAGGGLFVLEDPFGGNPRAVNLLADAVVEKGRYKGRSLEGGAFLSPELSCDGKTILFAWTEAVGEDLEWTERSCWHIFRANADGTELVQLTDGPWNDFDPCFLPNGRIVFVSERRGGYLRCGRHCPTYTLFGMEPDGGNITCVSYHETHEWHPSVDHDGMLVYTRWDYVDRDTNVAHHIWTSYPDGRDPRSFHGNYPVERGARPWMEMSIRAVPGSPKYVATAAAHHGHAFGSLVLIDHRPEDDNAMSQLVRLTPEVPFPEAEGGKKHIRENMVYGTPWPLSEEDYLVAYDRHTVNQGIYWIDRHGNRELLYRDPEIPSISPIPFRPRPKPPVIPDQTLDFAAEKPEKPVGTVAVMNVYDSDFDWPEGTAIKALRIIQVLPKTTPPPDEPRIGIGDQTNARQVLGTVPVEADGSIFFEVPAERLIYFQALDANGMAVQSMRSGTYLHAGEQLTCRGCHEEKRESAPPMGRIPLALRRKPTPLQPEPDGANPYSFARLVQPVLDRKCVECHQGDTPPDLRGIIEGEHGWTRSYAQLAKDWGFYFNVRNGSINDGIHGGSRSIPGAFGAMASPLMALLREGHEGVALTDEELRRITLWLDCNSEFYGAYENTEAQARGEAVVPALY